MYLSVYLFDFVIAKIVPFKYACTLIRTTPYMYSEEYGRHLF